MVSAFDENVRKNDQRFEEIKHLRDKFEWTRQSGYAHYTYSAKTTDPEAMKLSAWDVFILADSGNCCFGGSYSGSNGSYTGKVHTD